MPLSKVAVEHGEPKRQPALLFFHFLTSMHLMARIGIMVAFQGVKRTLATIVPLGHCSRAKLGQNSQKEAFNSAKLLFMASPAPIRCLEKERLLAAYGKAAEECIRLHSARTEAVLQDEEFHLLDRLSAAEITRENAKYAIIVHQHVHGC